MNLLILGNPPGLFFTELAKKVSGYWVHSGPLDLFSWTEVTHVLSYNYRHKIPESFIKAHPNLLNCHIGYLPYNRGADPNLWSWIDGTEKGFTIHQVTTQFDTGPYVIREEYGWVLDAERFTLKTSYEYLHERMIEAIFRSWENLWTLIPFPYESKGTFHTTSERQLVQPILDKYGWDTPCAVLEKFGKDLRYLLDEFADSDDGALEVSPQNDCLEVSPQNPAPHV